MSIGVIKNEPISGGGECQYEMCPTMNIISVLHGRKMTSYRVNWEKIYEIDANNRYGIIYKDDGKFFIVIDAENNDINIYDTNKGTLVTVIANKDELELISWSEGDNGEIIDTDSMFEYVERSMPLISSNDNSILEDKEKFDFILYGGANQLHLSIFGIFNIANLVRLEGEFLAHITSKQNIRDNFVLVQLDDDSTVCVYHLDIGFLQSYPNLNRISLICSKISKYFAALQDSIKSIHQESRVYVEHTAKLIDLLKGETTDYHAQLIEMLLTGMCVKGDGVHTWLSDYLADVGLTRWQGIALKCFKSCKDLIFLKIIPLIERLILNYTNLVSLMINKSKDQILAKLQQLLKIVYQFIIELNVEFKNFNRFIKWLQMILKSLNEDLSDVKKHEVMKQLSNVNIDTIIEFLDQNLNNSCLNKYSDKKHPFQSLTRDLQVFINAKFSILKMEIKKNFKVMRSCKITDLNLQYTDYCFVDDNKGGEEEHNIYIITAMGSVLKTYTLDTQTMELIQMQEFDIGAHIYKLKAAPAAAAAHHEHSIVSILTKTKLITVSLESIKSASQLPTDNHHSLFRTEFTFNQDQFQAHFLAANDELNLFIDVERHQCLIESSGNKAMELI